MYHDPDLAEHLGLTCDCNVRTETGGHTGVVSCQ